MSSLESTVGKLREKMEALQREKADLITAVSRHIDSILMDGQTLLHVDEAGEDSLQRSISAIDSCLTTCAHIHRRLSGQNVPREAASVPESFAEPPPSYNEVVSAHLKQNSQSQENPITLPHSHGAGVKSSSNFLAKFKPGRPLPEGTYLSSEEKRRPIPSFYGSWEFLSEGGWSFNEAFCSFMPPLPGLFYVTVEWRQCGEGTLAVGIGSVNESSVVDLYHKISETATTSNGEYGRLTELVDLQDRQGLWVSLLRYGKYPKGDYFFVMSDLAHCVSPI